MTEPPAKTVASAWPRLSLVFLGGGLAMAAWAAILLLAGPWFALGLCTAAMAAASFSSAVGIKLNRELKAELAAMDPPQG